MMKIYEITFIMKENSPAGEPFKTVLENAGGKILNISSIGEHQFVYPIKKETSGVYTTILFELEPEKLSDLNRKMSLNEEILRFLIVAKKASALKAMAEATNKRPEMEIAAPKEIAEPKAIEAPIEIEAPAEITEPITVTEVKKIEKPKVVKEKPKKVEKPKEKPKTIVESPKPTEPEISDISDISEEDRLKELDKKLDELLKD